MFELYLIKSGRIVHSVTEFYENMAKKVHNVLYPCFNYKC